MKRVAIYVRVSTQEQTQGHSIPEQLSRLKMYCEAHGWVLAEEYVDPGFSGANTNRPALQKLLRDIVNGGFDTVLVYKLDRLSRSQKDTMQLIEDVFIAHNIDFISMSENFDTSTPFGRAMIGILSVFAQLERDQIKERLMMGRVGRAKTGKWNGGNKPPVGYDYKDDQLSVIEYEAMQVRLIFDLFINGLNGEQLSLNQIRDYMQARYETRYSTWAHPASVGRVLKNRLYIGEIKYAEIWYPGDHDPIIDMETWEAAQQKYETYMKNFGKSQRQPFEGRNLLSGLLRCGHCGAGFYVSSGVDKRTKGTIRRHYYYRCYSKSSNKRMKKADRCAAKNYKRDILNQLVIDEIKKLALDPNEIGRLQGASLPENKESESEILRNRIAEIETQIDKLVDLYQLGRLDVSKLSARIDDLGQEKEKLLAELENKKEPPLPMKAEEVLRLVANCDAIFDNGTPEEQQALVRSLLKKIVIYDDHMEFHWAFCAQ